MFFLLTLVNSVVAQAIRDYEYMSRLAPVDPQDAPDRQISLTDAFPDIAAKEGAPYSTTYLTFSENFEQKPDVVREFLRKYLHRKLSWTAAEKRRRGNDFWQGKSPDIYSTFVDRFARFILAFAGGASLVVPMLVMVFDQSNEESDHYLSCGITVCSFPRPRDKGFQPRHAGSDCNLCRGACGICRRQHAHWHWIGHQSKGGVVKRRTSCASI
jgi:hypothetical protein